jgi:signal transduction histidine kinase
VCSDITRIKEVEKQGKHLRSHFFASIAHELRTPLNAIIPIIMMIIQKLQSGAEGISPAKIVELLQVVRSSMAHLSGVIEDALDLARLENNKFTLFKRRFDIRRVLKEIADVLRL